MTLNKDRIIEGISSRCGYSKKKSMAICESLLEIMKSTLESGEDVLISGFGKFSVKDKKSRRGRNPQTGNDLILKAHRVITFKSSTVLREKINGKG